MFNKITNKIKESIAKAEENRKEKERLQIEKLEKEKARLLSLDEKELLVELMLSMKNIESKQKDLIEKVQMIDNNVTMINNNIFLNNMQKSI